MAVDRTALDHPLARELAAGVAIGRPLRYRLGDAFLPEGTAPPFGTRLRCCTCGSGASVDESPTPCGLCGSRAWELLPATADRVLR
jgi:hypothetical protein